MDHGTSKEESRLFAVFFFFFFTLLCTQFRLHLPPQLEAQDQSENKYNKINENK